MSRPTRSDQVERIRLTSQGFTVWTLKNSLVQVQVVPELGAKILSLQNLRTGREWMWQPDPQQKLFANRLGDDFATSPLTGMDECLPTIAPCPWKGRTLPDHGEAWSVPWQTDPAAEEPGLVTTRVELRLTPFQFERTLALVGNEVRLDYRLRNRGASDEAFLWAMHPLLRLQPEDVLDLPESSLALLPGPAWKGPLAAAISDGNCAKLFLSPIKDGIAGIKNSASSDALEIFWDPAMNNTLGVWLTRGGWNGQHHFALEPTNGQPDALDVAVSEKRCGWVKAGQLLRWHVRLRLSR
jgi:galactose mutarotase-like enzyme